MIGTRQCGRLLPARVSPLAVASCRRSQAEQELKVPRVPGWSQLRRCHRRLALAAGALPVQARHRLQDAEREQGSSEMTTAGAGAAQGHDDPDAVGFARESLGSDALVRHVAAVADQGAGSQGKVVAVLVAAAAEPVEGLGNPGEFAADLVTGDPDIAAAVGDQAVVAVAALDTADLATAAAVQKTAPGPDTSGLPGTADSSNNWDRSTAGSSWGRTLEPDPRCRTS